MIDFASVHNDGLVVRCRTVDDSIAFWEEVKEVFPYSKSVFFERSHRVWHDTYGDRVAYYLRIEDDGLLRTEWCYEEYYRTHRPYCQSEFVDYSVGNYPRSDLGELEVEAAVDVSLLFSSEVIV